MDVLYALLVVLSPIDHSYMERIVAKQEWLMFNSAENCMKQCEKYGKYSEDRGEK